MANNEGIPFSHSVHITAIIHCYYFYKNEKVHIMLKHDVQLFLDPVTSNCKDYG